MKILAVKSTWKFLLSLSFIFDKAGSQLAFVRVGSFLLGMVVSLKRLATAVVVDRYIFYAQSFYDLFAAQTFLHMAIAQFSGSLLSINEILTTFSMTTFISLGLIYSADRLREKRVLKYSILTNDEPTAKTPQEAA